MSFKIVIAFMRPNLEKINFGEELLKPFDHTVLKGVEQTEDSFIAKCKDADAIVGPVSHGGPFTRRVIETLDKCRIIAGPSIAFEAIDLKAATDKGIVVCNNPDYCLDEVSGRIIAYILTLSYKIVLVDKVMREAGIDRNLPQVLGHVARTRGQTLGLVGLGKIATATALKARGLGLRVIAHDPYVFDNVMRIYGVEPVDMETLYKESDYISVHVPVTPATKNMIGYEQFKKMKRTCYFINASRGAVVDEPAMARALGEKLIAGAAIDVTVKEPLERDSPLLKLDNALITGHSAWYSDEAAFELFYNPMTQVVLALQGKWPLYAVNPQVREGWLKRWGQK